MVIQGDIYALALQGIGVSEITENVMSGSMGSGRKNTPTQIHHQLAWLTWLGSLPPEFKPPKTGSAVTIPPLPHVRRKFRAKLNAIVKGFFQQINYMDGISHIRHITTNTRDSINTNKQVRRHF
jgi:hypothetical protein